MNTWLLYAIFAGIAMVVSSVVTRYMIQKNVSIGVRRFVVSTIGTIAVLILWVFMRTSGMA